MNELGKSRNGSEICETGSAANTIPSSNSKQTTTRPMRAFPFLTVTPPQKNIER